MRRTKRKPHGNRNFGEDRNRAASMKDAESVCIQDSLPDIPAPIPKPSRDEIMRSKTLSEIRRAELLWKMPQFHDRVMAIVGNEVINKRRFSARWILDEIRRVDLVDDEGMPMKYSNNICPILGRLIIKEYSEASRYLKCNEAACDELMA